MSVVGIVQSTAQQTVSQGSEMSGFLGTCYQMIHKVHRLWRWYRRAEVYCNPDNILKLAAGHSVNWLAGDNAIVNVAAQVVLVATRITDCVEEQVCVAYEAKKFWSRASDPYALCPKVKWNKSVEGRAWISPSAVMWWKEVLVWIVDRIKRIAKGIFSIAKRLFLLSMKTLDAAEAFSYDKVKNERLNELFVNSSKCLKVLVQNKVLLMHGLKKYRRVIKQILQNTHSMFTVDQFLDIVSKSLGVAESVHDGIEKASEAVGVVGRDFAKRAAFGLFQAAGLVDLMPNSWVPTFHPVWMEENRDLEDKPRYPPVEDVSVVRNYQQLVDVQVVKTIRKLYFPKMGTKDLSYRLKCKDVEEKVRKRYAEIYTNHE
jgi:hypothetical protein